MRLGRKDGQNEWAIWGESFDRFLEFLRTQNGAGRSEPDFSISSISLSGAEEGDWAKLEAKLEIQVDRDVAVRIPIGLQEGSLRPGLRHAGPGEFRATDSLNRQKGHTIVLRGKGLHVVTIPLVVPIRRQLNQRHLQLTIPPAAGSQITLRVAKEHCQVKPMEDAPVHASSIPNGTLIEAVGIKGQFDLAWESPLDESHVRTVFDVFSKCTVAVDRDRIQVGVLQTIDPKQGNVASLRVRIPRGFPRVTGQQLYISDARQYGPSDLDANGFIKVDLKPAGTGRIELRWDLEGPPAATGILALQGFDVEGARSDIGDVSITPTEGFHFDYRGGGNIRRINVAALGAGLAESAYAFSQPFRLDLALEEIRPQFSVEPTYYLLLSQQRIELTVQLQVHVRHGGLRELKLTWPEWKKQGWTLDQLPESIELAEPEKTARREGQPRDDSGLALRLNGRRGDEFVVNFRASRPAASGTTISLSLPEVAGPTGTSGVLVAADAENIKSTLEPRPETAVHSIGPERHDALSRPDSFRGLRQVVLRIDSPKAAFDATVTAQHQKIETESRATIETQSGRLQVVQRISYRVSYERLSEATLVLPKELRRNSVQFTLDHPEMESKVEPSWTTGEPTGSDVARIPLSPQPRIGSFEIYAHYSVRLPEPSDQAVDLPVPLLRSRDSAYKSLRVELRAADESEFEVVDDAWIPSLAVDKGTSYAWTAKGEQTVLPLRLVRVMGLASPGIKITRALVRSSLDMTGTAQTTAQYRIEGPPSRLCLTLPVGATEAKFWLDRIALKPERIREARPESGEYRLDVGALSPNPQPVLTVQYSDANAGACGLLRLHHLNAPLFPDNTSIESTVWEVAFPYEQFLCYASPEFASEFRWQRDGAVWSRQATTRAADLGSRFGAVAAGADGGNSYPFSRFGPARTIVVGSMAGSFVIFVGAGLALLAAFVLLRLRAARSLLTLFLFAFAVAVSCLWFSEAVCLLLQPALAGFLLALGAALLDARIQRQRGRLLVEPPGAAEFVATAAASPSSIERGFAVNADPEAPTINRSAGQDGSHGSQTLSASGSGSRA